MLVVATATFSLLPCASSSLCAQEPVAVNLIENGSFERFAPSDIPDAWTGSSPSLSVARSTEHVRVGEYSLKLVDDSAAGSVRSYSSPVPISASAVYEAGAYVFRTSQANNSRLYIKYYDKDDIEVGSASCGATGQLGVWESISTTARAPVNAEYARLLCYSNIASTGYMYFDGVWLRRPELKSVSNSDMELDAIGVAPVSWEIWGSNSEPVTTALDPADSLNRVMKLADSSASRSTYARAHIAVTPNMSYTLSADILYESGDAPVLYLQYYDEDHTRISSSSNSTASIGAWSRKNLTVRAPDGASYARIIAYISIVNTGVSYFDNFTFTPNYVTRYVGAVAAGTGDGSSVTNAALYNSPTFWGSMDSLLTTSSIKVKMLEETYFLNQSADALNLEDVGDGDHVLIIEGEFPYGTTVSRDSLATTTRIHQFRFKHVENVVVRHIHWERGTAPVSAEVSYSITIQSTNGALSTQSVTIEGCSFVGLWQNFYGALGISGANTSNVNVWYNEFVGGGKHSGFHFIYNSYGTYHTRILANYFQDGTGSYVRSRAGSDNVVVDGNAFVADSASSWGSNFIEQAVFNDVDPGDELIGQDMRYTNNSFYYSGGGSLNSAFSFRIRGYDPVVNGVGYNYLLTSAEGNTMSSGSIQQVSDLLFYNYGLDFSSTGNILIENNSYLGTQHSQTRILFHTSVNYGAVPKGGDGNYDITDVVEY